MLDKTSRQTVPSGGVLAVFAHPDDESLSAGGLLVRTAEDGLPVAVLTCTWAPGTHRVPELAEALGHLGAGSPRLLGYADARVAGSAPGRPRWVDVPLDEAAAAIGHHLDELRPDVVVTHDHHGGLTGHEDHVHTHDAVARAVEGRPVTLLLATHPDSARARLGDLVGSRRAVHTVPDDDVDLVLDVRAELERKVAAVLAHRSEVERGALPGVVAGLGQADRERLLGTEWYLR